MKRTLLFTLLAGLALAPVAARAQSPAYPTHEGTYDQNGYYDHTGHWHAGENNPYPDGYFDQDGVFHRYADERGYDPNADRNADTSGGYYDQSGNWVPDATQPPYGSNDNGNYGPNGQWQQYDNDANRYDNRYDNRYGDSRDDRSGRAYNPERWSYDERGRAETLDLAARDFALTADSLAREARRHATYRDRAALEALQRLDRAAARFARVAYRGNRPETVGRAYFDVVSSFAEAQRRFAGLRPDGRLSNQFHVLASAMGRLDRGYFGGRAFGGQNPEWGGYRPY